MSDRQNQESESRTTLDAIGRMETHIMDLVRSDGEQRSTLVSILQHLVALNGKVAAHEKEIGEIRTKLEVRASEKEATDKANARWVGLLAPVGKVLFNGIVGAVMFMLAWRIAGPEAAVKFLTGGK